MLTHSPPAPDLLPEDDLLIATVQTADVSDTRGDDGWYDEILRRAAELDAGLVTAVPWTTVVKRRYEWPTS